MKYEERKIMKQTQTKKKTTVPLPRRSQAAKKRVETTTELPDFDTPGGCQKRFCVLSQVSRSVGAGPWGKMKLPGTLPKETKRGLENHKSPKRPLGGPWKGGKRGEG